MNKSSCRMTQDSTSPQFYKKKKLQLHPSSTDSKDIENSFSLAISHYIACNLHSRSIGAF